jgi:hypothetical protein
VVYAATDVATVDGEFERLLARANLPATALQPRRLTTIRLDLHNVLDLRDEELLRALGIRREDLLSDDAALPRLVGEVAHEMGYEALIAPSVAGPGDVVAIFPANRGAESTIEIAGVRPFRAGRPD